MKIIYRDGHAIEAIAFSRTTSTMRLAIPGQEDVLELRRVSDAWVTEDCEPVILQQESVKRALAEGDCICPPELAAHLIRLLQTNSSEELETSSSRPERGVLYVAERLA